MSIYKEPNDFIFDNSEIRGFEIKSFLGENCHIVNIVVKFKSTRTIVFEIITDDRNVISKLANKEINGKISGIYYDYKFLATIKKHRKIANNYKYNKYEIAVDLIEFGTKDVFFINSKDKFNIEIIPTNSLVEYSNDKKKLKFEDITFEELKKKYIYIAELYSAIYKQHVMIEKIYCSNEINKNIIFRTQYIDDKLSNNLEGNIFMTIKNNHFSKDMHKYIDKYIDFKETETYLNLLLHNYLIYDLFDGKEIYTLNDISGFIDLFDGIFIDIKIKNKEVENTNNERNRLSRCFSLKEKIKYVLKQLELNLPKVHLHNNKEAFSILADFRNNIRHQKKYEHYNLDEIFIFSEGVLRLYFIKYILAINSNDYDIENVLAGFNIYNIIEYKFTYKDKEILLYSTSSYIQKIKGLSSSCPVFKILKKEPYYLDITEKDLVYDESHTKKIKTIFLDENNEILYCIWNSGLFIMDKKILNIEDISFSYKDFETLVLC